VSTGQLRVHLQILINQNLFRHLLERKILSEMKYLHILLLLPIALRPFQFGLGFLIYTSTYSIFPSDNAL